MVTVIIDDDRIAVPIPTRDVIVIERSDAKVEVVKEEALAISSSEPELVAAPKTIRETAVLPGMIEMKTRLVAAGIMAHPLTVVVHVRRFRMAGLIVEGAMLVLRARFVSAIFLGPRRRAAYWCRAVRRDITAADIARADARLIFALPPCVIGVQNWRDAQSEKQGEYCGKIFHVESLLK